MTASRNAAGRGVARGARPRAYAAARHPRPRARAAPPRRRPRAPVVAARRVDDRARRRDERARRARLRTRRATSAGVPPCAPTPGQEERRPAAAAAAPPRSPRDTSRRRRRRPTREPRSPTSPRPSSPTSSATCCHSGRPSASAHVLHVAAARIRRLHEAEDPGAVAPARVEERLERVAAEIRVHGDGVGERDERLGVRARGRADVAALHVGDHEQARLARVRADVLEGAHPSAPRASKNADCGLTATACSARRRRRSRSRTPRDRSLGGQLAGLTGRARRRAGSACRSTASASRSAKCVTATVAIGRKPTSGVGGAQGPRARPSKRGGGAPSCQPVSLLDGRLERAAGRELRHARRRDLDLLRRVARIDAGAGRALLRLELAEAGERDVAAASSVSVIVSRNASTALPASRAVS